MIRILKIIGIIIAVLIVTIGLGYLILAPHPLEVPESVENLTELEIFLDEYTGYNTDSPPGLSLIVVNADGILYEKGFGIADPFKKIEAGPDTVYNQWSLTKPYTAIAIFQLYERGLLDIDLPVSDYLDFFHITYPEGFKGRRPVITVRHLLNHSSGIRNNSPEVVGWIHTDGTPEYDQTQLIKEKFPDYAELTYDTGSQGVYTNIGYMLLAAIIESVSDQSYQDYMIENIFKPLKMDLTNWTYTDEMIAHEAIGAHPRVDFMTLLLPMFIDKPKRDAIYRVKQDGFIWFNHVYNDQKGSSGIIGPPSDTARFLRAMLNRGELDGVRILQEETVLRMISESHIEPGNTPEAASYQKAYHGLGWVVVKEGESLSLRHTGGGAGFSVNMRFYPDKNIGMAIMANHTYFASEKILDLVTSLDW